MSVGVTHPWIKDRGPIYIVRWPARRSLAELEAVYEALARIGGAATRPFAVVADIGSIIHSTAAERAIAAQAEVRITRLPGVIHHCKGVAVVAPSAIQRGIVTALSWFQNRPYPHVVYATEVEAVRFAQRVVEEATFRSRTGT